MGPATQPDQEFIDELNGTTQVQPALVVNLTADRDAASERIASQANTSAREGSVSSESMALDGEPVQSCQRNRSRALHVNGTLIYRVADWEMVDRAGNRLVYSVDYFTLAITS